MITENLSDWAEEGIRDGTRTIEDMDECAYCGMKYDPYHEGYTDESTGLCFCDAPCEMHYDQETGLPEGYKLAS